MDIRKYLGKGARTKSSQEREVTGVRSDMGDVGKKRRRIVEEVEESLSVSTPAEEKTANTPKTGELREEEGEAGDDRAAIETDIVADEEKEKGGENEAHDEEEYDDEDLVDEVEENGVAKGKKTKKGAAATIPEKWDPSRHATWPKDSDAPYSVVVKAFCAIEETKSRLAIQTIVSNLFRAILLQSPSDLLPAVYLCCNRIAPEFTGIELGVGDGVLVKALSNATKRKPKDIQDEYREKGDLGLLAIDPKKSQTTLFGYKPKPLTVRGVHAELLSIAKEAGTKSQQKKIERIESMLGRCVGEEGKFLIRALQGKLRIGLAEKTVLIALAHALVLTPPTLEGVPGAQISDIRDTLSESLVQKKLEEGVSMLKQVYSELPSYDEVVAAVLKHGLAELHSHCHARAGVPLKPMLAKPTKGVTEILDRFSNTTFTCEFKYDGERAQIHMLEDGTVQVYSRNSESNTSKYPDVVELMPEVVKAGVTSFILDSEVVAYDAETGKLLPFQILSTRARKNVATEDVKVKIIVCAFDILYVNGRSVLGEPLKVRRDLLHDSFRPVEGRFMFAQSCDASDPEEMQSFLAQAVAGNCEGLMVKSLEENASYEPSRRSLNWLKLKKDYMDGVTDSLDLVPIGAFHGQGKRTGVFGAYMLACYDDDAEEFQAICKLGTGLDEEQLEAFNSAFRDKVLPRKPTNYSCNVECDVWLDSVQVWEILAADLSISPVYTAAIDKVKSGKGISLRFPRFIRIRDDKNPEHATNAAQVADLYRNQNLAQTSKAQNEEEDDDL